MLHILQRWYRCKSFYIDYMKRTPRKDRIQYLWNFWSTIWYASLFFGCTINFKRCLQQFLIFENIDVQICNDYKNIARLAVLSFAFEHGVWIFKYFILRFMKTYETFVYNFLKVQSVSDCVLVSISKIFKMFWIQEEDMLSQSWTNPNTSIHNTCTTSIAYIIMLKCHAIDIAN